MLERAPDGLGFLAGDGQRNVATVDRHVTGADRGRTRGTENVLERLIHLERRTRKGIELEEGEMVEETREGKRRQENTRGHKKRHEKLKGDKRSNKEYGRYGD